MATSYSSFVAYGLEICDAAVEFYTSGEMEIEIYENEAEEPTKIITV